MSTDYRLVCDEHRQKIDAATIGMSDIMFDCPKGVALPTFIIAHAACRLRVLSEHDEHEGDSAESYVKWDENNYERLGDELMFPHRAIE